MKQCVLALALVLAMTGAAVAQNDEIVVTATRYNERYEAATVPHVAVVKRADFLVAYVAIESDTRDLATRRGELVQTIAEVDRRARAGGPVTVALLEEAEDDAGDTRVKPFTSAAAQGQIRSGGRADTSTVSLVLRTQVQPADTLASAEGRLDAFVRSLPKPGRVTLASGEPQLTIVSPSKYRAEIVAAIAADARAIMSALGAGHGARIEGLENRIAWRRSADLELMLYIPHRLQIEPARAP